MPKIKHKNFDVYENIYKDVSKDYLIKLFFEAIDNQDYKRANKIYKNGKLKTTYHNPYNPEFTVKHALEKIAHDRINMANKMLAKRRDRIITELKNSIDSGDVATADELITKYKIKSTEKIPGKSYHIVFSYLKNISGEFTRLIPKVIANDKLPLVLNTSNDWVSTIREQQTRKKDNFVTK